MTTLLVISPDFASHYGPLAVLARAARAGGCRVVVATGPTLRPRVEADGFEWTSLPLGAGSNDGTVAADPGIVAFLAATRDGPAATIRHQALARERDLLWCPELVASRIADVVDRLRPDAVLADHVSFGSTLGLYATGRPFVTLVPGHPSQLPVAGERYGIPARWPTRLRPDPGELAALEALADQVTASLTERWNAALATVAPGRPPVADAFRVHGTRVLYNSPARFHHPGRDRYLPADHRFVGPLVRSESLPPALARWLDPSDGRPRVYVALGTFLSRRTDVLAVIADALRTVGVRAAIAVGPTPTDPTADPTADPTGRRHPLGPIPGHWLVAPTLPQVALVAGADLAITHGGNNSVQEALAAGARQILLPFSTDQFATAADLERTGGATVLAPNEMDRGELVAAITDELSRPRPDPVAPVGPADLLDALRHSDDPVAP